MEKAIQLFKAEGFEHVTVDRICQECNVSKGSFYHHFPSKNDILLCFYDSTSTHALSMTLELLELTSPINQLWKVFEDSIDRTIALGADLLKHMLLLDIQRGNSLLNPYGFEQDKELQEFANLVKNIIKRGQSVGEIRVGEPKDLIFAYISGLLGVAMNWSASGGGYDEKAELYRLFCIIFCAQ